MSPDQKFDEGLRRCFNFWFMLEVSPQVVHILFYQSEQTSILALEVRVQSGEVITTVWENSVSEVQEWREGQVRLTTTRIDTPIKPLNSRSCLRGGKILR